MKVVRFENGKFAVRKWVPFEYVYLDNDIVRSFRDRWWRKHLQQNAYVDTEEQARLLLAEYNQRKRKPRFDKGTPV